MLCENAWFWLVSRNNPRLSSALVPAHFFSSIGSKRIFSIYFPVEGFKKNLLFENSKRHKKVQIMQFF